MPQVMADYHWVGGSSANWLELGTVADLTQIYQRDGNFPSNVFDTKRIWCQNHTEFTDYLVLECLVAIAHELSGCLTIVSFYL
jgi:hypothetical protein